MNLSASLSLDHKAAYLRTLPAIRERSGRVFDLAKQGKLEYFEYHPEKEADVTAFCTEIIKVTCPTNVQVYEPTFV
jgi:hypothetical protein